MRERKKRKREASKKTQLDIYYIELQFGLMKVLLMSLLLIRKEPLSFIQKSLVAPAKYIYFLDIHMHIQMFPN